MVAASTKTIYYKVKAHETLAKIASKYGVTEASIKKWNKLKSSALYTGENLKVVITTYKTAESPGYAQAFSSKVLDKSIPFRISK